MKILHTSDWHLGSTDAERSLLEDQEYFVNAICDIVQSESVDAVVIAGDVYDRSVASAEAIKLYDYAMTRLCAELKRPVLVIAGNHDSAERLSSCGELLSAAGLYIAGSLKRTPFKVEFNDADIYLLPWFTEEKVKSVFPEERENITSLETAYRTVINALRANFAPGKRHILVSHAYITDSETSDSDRAAVIGNAPNVPANVFDGFDYVALGHIHKPQNVSGISRYSGTPMPYSFGKEESQKKSVTMIDTADMSKEIVPLPLLHKRKTLKGTLEELLTNDYDEEIINGYVRLEVTDGYVGLETLAQLKGRFSNLLEVSGKTYEGDETKVSMTIEELEKFEENPMEVFKYFCKDNLNMEPDEHLLQLFEDAVKSTEEGEQ